ncbi:fumarylacetoacetate hydrolase family protein [Devosia ginsengisoli]|uniref:fumarylacetoacetate hydrolase family protein n=1 Tax=Devosia ginsengisoli TaxID=400770 RepID=UPI0026F0B98B|nr:fumarylacetoacetate hydrolase family protein [Devosia ginsengisoli]MCR6669770.1 fumarylacetoacetate hydrolase family protein [Devosia ginsengisoli]
MNYRDHAAEGGHPPPEYPAIFMRAATSLGADGATLAVPHNSCQLDYEAELAVIIGTRGHRIARTAALDHVFGYAVFNDISVRDFQKKSSQWTMGKNFDGTGILGPTLVTAERMCLRGAAGPAITSRLNGQTMQSSNTREMIFGVAEAIALISDVMTLEPGDIIAMGTPAGVGFAQTPPRWLTPGDEITIEISGMARNRYTFRRPAERQRLDRPADWQTGRFGWQKAGVGNRTPIEASRTIW